MLHYTQPYEFSIFLQAIGQAISYRKTIGYRPNDLSFTKTALVKIIEGYAREARVRNLGEEIANIIRKILIKIPRIDVIHRAGWF